MNGTTLCPHCQTRFKIAEAQLTAHQGMVRCGHCMQAFDARPNFIAEPLSPQSPLEPVTEQAEAHHAPVEAHPADLAETPEEIDEAAPPVDDTANVEITEEYEPYIAAAGETAAAEEYIDDAEPASEANDSVVTEHDAAETERNESPSPEHDDTLDFSVAAAEPLTEPAITEELTAPEQSTPSDEIRPQTLAEQVVMLESPVDEGVAEKSRRWPWAMASALLVLLLAAQATYFFRIGLAAHMPALKPALLGYCQLLNCRVPLPRNTDLMSIESSSLVADADHENQITLTALLRNRAAYTLEFPVLELTLNDSQDNPLARRLFLPSDYLPADENEISGFPKNHEVSLTLRLNTAELRPLGYRLELFYKRD